MKKIIGALVLYLFITSPLAAQVSTAIKAGAGFSSLHYKYGSGNQGRVGYYGGIAVQVDVARQLFIQPELLYSLRGYSFPAVGNNSKGRVGYGYISVPLLGGYKASKQFSLLLGPEIGYMISAKSHFNSSNTNIISLIGKRFSVDVDAGMAWAPTSSLTLEARFILGITGLYRGITTDQYGNETGTIRDGFNRMLQVGVAYSISH